MQKDKTSLEERMHLAQKGDRQAYASLLSEISQIIRGYLLKRLPGSEDVEDVLQEILISVHKARHTYDKSRPFKPWLFCIAKFRLYDFFRKTYRKAENEASYFEEKSHEISENVTNSDDQYEELYKAMDGLPEKQKKIIEMMKIGGYTAKEVAKHFDMSESAVKVAAHRAYKILKERMEKGG